MPPVNAKAEAERLQKAKLAISKMKNMKQRPRSAGKVDAAAGGLHPNVRDALSPALVSRKGKVPSVSKVSESTGTGAGTLKRGGVAPVAEGTRFSRRLAMSREQRSAGPASEGPSAVNGHGRHGKPSELVSTRETKEQKAPRAPSLIPRIVLQTEDCQEGAIGLFETPPVKLQKNELVQARKSMGLGELSPFIQPSAVRKVYSKKSKVSSTSQAGPTSGLVQSQNGFEGGNSLGPLPARQLKRVSFSLDSSNDEKQVGTSSKFALLKQSKTCEESGSPSGSVSKLLPLKKKKLKEKRLKLLKLVEEESGHLGNISCIKPSRSEGGKKIKSKKDKILEKLDSLGYSGSDSPARSLKKVNKLLALGLRKSRIANKKGFAPMSIKMTSGSGKGPLFVVTENEPNKVERLSVKLTEIRDINSKSAFTVTTVPERMCGAEGEDDGVSSMSESDESNDSQQGAEEVQGSDSEIESDEVLTEPPGSSTATKRGRDGIEDSLNDGSKVQFYFVDDQLVLHLKHPTSFAFCGHIQVEVLKGAVESLGFLITPSSGPHSILSPLNRPLMTLQTVAIGKCSSPSLSSLSHDFADLIKTGNPHDSFIIIKKEDNTMLSFLEQYMKKDFLPRPTARKRQEPSKMADNHLQCLCMPASRKFKALQKGKLWDEVFTNTSKELGCTLLSGGKGVGKSTILRHFVNRYLSRGAEGVVVIDFDPGQSELTVPGCVSLSVVKKPLLGPNFYNQQDPFKCIYIGEVNLVDCVSRYFSACSAIINCWRSEEQFRKMPCLVNTMGFTQGLGVTLMVQILSVLQPTSVIQIQSSSAALNYPDLLSAEYVAKSFFNSPFRMQLSAQGYQLACPSSLNYDLHVINSEVGGGSDLRKINPAARFNRDTAVLAYVSKIVHPPITSLLQVVPYCCPLDSLYLHVAHESVSPSVILSTFNANLVALCCIDPEEEDITAASEPGLPSIVKGQLLADCLGFGIVRGIDMDSRKLYLLTPVAPSNLKSVNCLALGAINLPSCVFLSPPKVVGFVPYVVTKQKSFLPTYFEKSN